MRCRCGNPASSGSHRGECPSCFRERLGTVQTAFAPTRSVGAGQVDRTSSKRWDNRLEDYRRVRMEGSQPRTTKREHIEEAKRISDEVGAPFRADAKSRGLEPVAGTGG